MCFLSDVNSPPDVDNGTQRQPSPRASNGIRISNVSIGRCNGSSGMNISSGHISHICSIFIFFMLYLWDPKVLLCSLPSQIRRGAEQSENMSLWFCISLWTSFSGVLRNVAAQSPSYIPHRSQLTFDEATAACSPGHLTTLATKREVHTVLELISASPPIQDSIKFWVGLRKANKDCMVRELPLRGFKWMADGSEVTQVSQWAVEPEETCATVQCAALRAQANGSTVTEWGLIPVRCRTKHWFICKHDGSLTPKPPIPTTPNLVPTSAELEPRRPTPTSDKQNPEIPDVEVEPSQGTGFHYGSEPDRGCPPARSSQPRSWIMDPKDRSRIQVECWTHGVLVEVRCSGQPALWRLLDGSVANFTSICAPCDDGFQKSSSGKCEDVDECSDSSAPCRNTCQNTPGSYRCVCTDENGDVVSEDSPMCKDTAGTPGKGVASGLLIPLLVAVVALVVLLVLVAVMIKCCAMRRSKRRAAKKKGMSMSTKDEKKPAI